MSNDSYSKLRKLMSSKVSTSQDDADLNRQTASEMQKVFKKMKKENPNLDTEGSFLGRKGIDTEIEEYQDKMEDAGEKQRIWGRTKKLQKDEDNE